MKNEFKVCFRLFLYIKIVKQLEIVSWEKNFFINKLLKQMKNDHDHDSRLKLNTVKTNEKRF